MNSSRAILFAIMLLISLCQNFVLFCIFIVAMSLIFVAQNLLLAFYEYKYLRYDNLSEEQKNEIQFNKIMKILLTKQK